LRYRKRVKSRRAATCSLAWLAVWLLSAFALAAQPKAIRLRNEMILTPEPAKQAAAAPAAEDRAPVSGLFLIQFTGPFQPAWQEELRVAGAQLLRYVPEDAFVARLDKVPLSGVKSLNFVRWVGEYRPDHKVHSAVRNRKKGALAAGILEVSVLLSPAATPAEMAEARSLFQEGPRESQPRFGAVLRGKVAAAGIDRLARSPAVLWIEPAPHPRLNDEIASKIVAGDGGTHVTLVQSLGFDGAGVRVAVADTGLHTGNAATMHPDLLGRVPGFFYYGSLTDAADEHGHGTHVAGIVAGNGATGETDDTGALFGLGVAPRAQIVVQRIFDADGNFQAPPSNGALTEDAVRAGAEIGSNSWGDDVQGRYDLNAAEFDALVRDADDQTPGDQPYILEFSAGNAGPGAQTLDSPAVAKNVIATGASENDRLDFLIYADGPDAMADFSSRGPCEDGRIKPDLVAPGTWISSLRSPLGNDDNAWAPISDNYLFEGGTSQAGPHVSGAAAVFVQYYRQSYGSGPPSPALVKAALINSATDMDDTAGTGPTPNMDEGWGRVDLSNLIGSPRRYDFIDQGAPLATGQTFEHHVVIATAGEPLNVTLAYTDYPGFPAAIPALVNDLDLEVVAPDGSTYHGNQFDQGESVPNAPGKDNLNNVEGVHLSQPLPGDYLVRVRARNVVQDARRDTPAVDQDFALVISGDIPIPGVGILLLDRPAYTAPSLIRIELIDTDLAGQSSAIVQIKSATEANGLPVLLRPTAVSGIFTGSVATATGPAANDGRLEIAHGDWIEADYFDASAGITRIAIAVADLIPPIITNVSVTNEFGTMVVSWTTDERANSVVRFNTNATLSRVMTNAALVTMHEVDLTNLVAGRTYRFAVSSTDAAGNTATNDNGGALFSFVAVPAATVLLVDAYEIDTLGGSDTIPLSAYTDALAQTGVSFEVWDKSLLGSPTADKLAPFQVVMWRINDSFYLDTSLTAAEQSAVTTYLNRGGAFFLSSMEILTRIGTVPFVSNVFHVQAFAEDAGVPEALGREGDPIGSGIDVILDYSAYPTLEGFLDDPDISDTITPTANATPILFDAVSGQAAGISFPRTGLDSTGRVVFLSFPLDAVPQTGASPNDRADLLRRVLSFLLPGVNGLGTIALDSPVYTIPSLVAVEVGDSDLIGLGQPTVTLYSDTQTTGQTVTLGQTATPGLFRGFITLVAATNPPAAGQLRAQNGDLIRADYFDASAHGTVEATARVDTQAPAITGIVAAPDYQQATVSWDTSEETDALVQFGESAFLGRTAYDPNLNVHHDVVVTGLAPDRAYFYQVVSRDAAGNTTMDDNQGALYTFRTLRPLAPPFIDNLESGGTNWSVLNGEGSQTAWTLGPPNNGRETQAHSPINAWGSDLNGDSLDAADTALFSPAINLINGNVATLSFWHSYDFTDQSGSDINQFGELLIVTNSAGNPTTLAQYYDANSGWEQEEIDLTPYLGQVVYLVWHYQLFSIDSAPRPGWLVDDISVTVSNLVTGTIEISNNLAQAQFTLIGPISRTGQGMLATFNNAPAGDYVVTFLPVPFYQTPAPQTNALVAAATLIFQGTYSFTDINSNGIADAWELQYFGAVSPTRTRSTDTDGDGFTDYAEFIAGTDPNSPASKLALTTPAMQADGTLRLQWPSVAGRAYRVEGSSDAIQWVAVSDWTLAASDTMSLKLPAPVPGAPYLFRVEVHP